MTQVNPGANPGAIIPDSKMPEQKGPEQKAAKPAAEPTLSQKAGLKVGAKVHLKAVHGRMIHPFQNELPFVTDKATKCEFDRWCEIQFDAGKLALDD